MTQPSTMHTSQQTLDNHDNNHSIQHQSRPTVRETVQKINMLEKTNGLSSSRLAIPTIINNNHTNETPTSSMSSSNESTNSDYAINSNPIEKKRSQSSEKSTQNSTNKTNLLTKSQISTARIDTRPLAQQKPRIRRRRSSPPIPTQIRYHRKLKQNASNNIIHANSENEFENHQNEIYDDTEIDESESFQVHAEPAIVYQDDQVPSAQQTHENSRSRITTTNVRRETNEPVLINRRQIINDNEHLDDQRIPSSIAPYEVNEIPVQYGNILPPSSHRPPPPLPRHFHRQQQHIVQEEPQSYVRKRTFPLSNFMMEIGALLVVVIVCMVLVLAIRQDEAQLRITMQIVYTYIYGVSIIWMIWCTFDIIKFRRKWMALTASAHDCEDYMDITERHSDSMVYFPDIHNTGGLFMRIGAGLFCMGSLILTVIELAKTIATIESHESTRLAIQYSPSVTTTKSISYIFRFLFHCLQFTFLFRYGNLVIDHYQLIAKIGLIHLIIANFCTWFEAIVYETLEQMHKNPENHVSTSYPTLITTIATTINETNITSNPLDFIKAMPDSNTNENKSTLEILNQIESSMGVYLYPCLIEYSLISLTVFFIMWRNVGKTEKRSFLRFRDRHVFTINCARASHGLLIGGIIFLLTIVTLIPIYLLDDDAILVTQITELTLLIVSLITVCISYIYTTKLYYDRQAHVNIFDQILILITTVGDFAYSFFGLCASIFIDKNENRFPIGVETSIGILAIVQIFLQSGFIMDTLKRRTITKQEIRNKPGRETITALLLMNLAIWMHDSLSAKKVRVNPLQATYYDASTWAIIQAFTSPLSIFYRFHSSVCLADIWQEVYSDNDGTRSEGKNGIHRSATMNSSFDNQI